MTSERGNKCCNLACACSRSNDFKFDLAPLDQSARKLSRGAQHIIRRSWCCATLSGSPMGVFVTGAGVGAVPYHSTLVGIGYSSTVPSYTTESKAPTRSERKKSFAVADSLHWQAYQKRLQSVIRRGQRRKKLSGCRAKRTQNLWPSLKVLRWTLSRCPDSTDPAPTDY